MRPSIAHNSYSKTVFVEMCQPLSSLRHAENECSDGIMTTRLTRVSNVFTRSKYARYAPATAVIGAGVIPGVGGAGVICKAGAGVRGAFTGAGVIPEAGAGLRPAGHHNMKIGWLALCRHWPCISPVIVAGGHA